MTPEPTPVSDWNLDNMVAESYAMRNVDGCRAFGVRGITGSTPVVTKAKVTYDSGGSWEWAVTDNDPNLKAQYFDNAWPNSVAGEDTRKITLYDADGNEVISKTGFTVEMKTYIGESDWNVDNVKVEIDSNNGEIQPDVTIRGITGSTPTCTKIRFSQDSDTITVDIAVSNNNPNVTAVPTSPYISMNLYKMDDRRMDLLNSDGDILATKIGWEVDRHN